MNFYDDAHKRVNDVPALTAHRDTLLCDRSEGDSHWEWVATAPVAEIVDWAEMVESMEREFELMDKP